MEEKKRVSIGRAGQASLRALRCARKARYPSCIIADTRSARTKFALSPKRAGTDIFAELTDSMSLLYVLHL